MNIKGKERHLEFESVIVNMRHLRFENVIVNEAFAVLLGHSYKV